MRTVARRSDVPIDFSFRETAVSVPTAASEVERIGGLRFDVTQSSRSFVE